MEGFHVTPPDGGYGWVVVTSSFFIMGLTAGVLKNTGLFLLEIQRHYGVLTSTISWVNSTTVAMFHLGGLGLAFSWISANSMVSHYFLRWCPIAYAIASSGECVLAMMFSPLFQWLIEAYTWQGCLLIIGGLQLNLCVCGALMRPLEAPSSQKPSQDQGNATLDSAESGPVSGKPSFRWSLIRKPELLLYIVFAILAVSGFFVPLLFLAPYATSLGVDQYRTASVLSALALADLGGRLACGWLANLRLARNLQLLVVVTTLLGVTLLLLPLGRGYGSVLAFSALYGFLFGCVVAVHVTSISDVVGLESFDSSLGLFMLFRSIGGFVGPPAAGWLVDWTNDLSVAFYMSGCCLILSGVFVVLVDRLVEWKKKVPSSDPESTAVTESNTVRSQENSITEANTVRSQENSITQANSVRSQENSITEANTVRSQENGITQANSVRSQENEES